MAIVQNACPQDRVDKEQKDLFIEHTRSTMSMRFHQELIALRKGDLPDRQRPLCRNSSQSQGAELSHEVFTKYFFLMMDAKARLPELKWVYGFTG